MAVRSGQGSASAPARDGSSGLHTRKSSGLVRAVGTTDTMRYSVLQAAVQFFFLITAFWVFYPGASMELATVFAVLGTVATGIVYGLYCAVYPRSGGEYVFLSRSLHPAAGFTLSFSLAFWQAWSVGITAGLLAVFAVSPSLVAIGVQTGNAWFVDAGTWVGSDWGKLVVGGADVLLFGFLLYRGMGLYFRVQKWLFVVAGISLLATFGVLIVGAAGGLDFHRNFDEVVGQGAYAKVLSDASAAGVQTGGGFDLGATLNFAIWPAQSVLFAFLAASFAGEIRSSRRGPLIGIVGGVVVAGVLLIMLEFLTRQAVGDQFLKAASGLALGDNADQWPLPNVWVPLLTSILGGSTILSVVINLWYIVLSMMLPAAVAIYASRVMLAWSVDGMAPQQLGRVSPKYHTPGVAIAVTLVIGLVTLVLYSFTDLFVVLSAYIGQGLGFLFVAIAGAWFPYRKRQVYEDSSARLQVFGLPLMTVTAVPGAVFLMFVLYARSSTTPRRSTRARR